jgi:hypothetical protein
MLRKIGLASAMVILAVIIYATLVPIGFRPKTGHVHLERIAAYLALGGALTVAFPHRVIWVALALILTACGLEYAQTFIPTRDGHLFDAMEKSFGALLGVVGGWLLTWAVERQSLSFKPRPGT